MAELSIKKVEEDGIKSVIVTITEKGDYYTSDKSMSYHLKAKDATRFAEAFNFLGPPPKRQTLDEVLGF
jgi:hypothetical protein